MKSENQLRVINVSWGILSEYTYSFVKEELKKLRKMVDESNKKMIDEHPKELEKFKGIISY